MQLKTSLAVVIALSLSGCASDQENWRYSRQKAQKSLTKLEDPGLVIGEFTLAKDAVVDGDTIKVDGLETSLRLLAIDTEEKFRNKADERMAETDFQAYLAKKRSESRRPPKVATPMGLVATRFGKEFFAGVKTVRLERDHPKEIRGRFNRYLAYVFARKDGVWKNYNVEAVRAGMSPYFTKYGYSRRFHDDFVAAENEARAAKRGIWDPAAPSYGDYDLRKAWWDARAEFVKTFEIEAQDRADMIALTNWDALKRLGEHEGKEVEVLATVGDIRMSEKGPTRVLLSRRMFNDFPVIFWDRDVFGTSRIGEYRGEFVRVRGVVNKYHNKYNGKDVLQIIVNLPAQVKGSELPSFEKEPS